MDLKLEVVVPVTDVDKAKHFYGTALGSRLDADVTGGDGFRLVQVTPSGSACSIIFGHGVTSAEPGSLDRLVFVVDDIGAARDELLSHGARAPGPDPEGRSYASFAAFSDPDGNRWLLQEITERLPGRV